MEVWKQIDGFPSYEVSNMGQIRSIGVGRFAGRVLKGGVDRDGYRRLVLCNDIGRKSMKFASIVCEAFIGPRPQGMVIRHINGVLTDNRAENLCYGTQKENIADKRVHGTNQVGERASNRILSEKQAIEIIKSGESAKSLAERFCVSCPTIYAIKSGRLWKHIKRAA